MVERSGTSNNKQKELYTGASSMEKQMRFTIDALLTKIRQSNNAEDSAMLAEAVNSLTVALGYAVQIQMQVNHFDDMHEEDNGSIQ